MKVDAIVKKSASEDQLLHYKALSKTLQRQVDRLLKDRGQFHALIEEFKRTVPALESYPMIDITPSEAPAGKKSVAAVIKVSDWQIGEVINAKETDGFGRFTYKMAERRVFILTKKVIDWTAMHRKAGFTVPELHIFSEADLVSGNIHYELEVTNEFPVTEATLRAGHLLAEMVRRLAPHFKKVTLWELSNDNHGRLTRKNQGKQGGINNWSYVAHHYCNALLSQHRNVFPVMSAGTKLLANVMGKKFLIAHGHHIMGQMGIPYYGMQRDKAREAVKRMNTSKKFDYLSIGHWHIPAIIDGNILVNGNLPGTTEFDHMQGRHGEPSQVSFMVHPVHGLFNWTAWKLR